MKDQGSTSSSRMTGAMTFNPLDPLASLRSPTFKRITVRLGNGKSSKRGFQRLGH